MADTPAGHSPRSISRRSRGFPASAANLRSARKTGGTDAANRRDLVAFVGLPTNPRSRGFPASAANVGPTPKAGPTHLPAGRPLVAVVGPTASGKSDLALRLALAFDGEIVSADSRQVYRFMDVGTAKPTPEERAAVRHWLIDVVDPDAEFSLATYLDLANAALADIWRRRLTAFLVGGSGQYVWALLEGWQVPRVAPDADLRRSLEERAERQGPDTLYSELFALDPAAAARVDSHNVRRLVRALELQRRSAGAQPREKLQPEFQPRILAIDWPRAELYRRIDERVDRMLARRAGGGLVEEVRGLLARGYSAGLPPMSGIGYRQVVRYLKGEMSLDEVAATMKTETHRVARMQNAWFRRDDPRIHWLDAAGDPFGEASELIRKGPAP